MVTSIIGKEAEKVQPILRQAVAARLGFQDRIDLSVQVLAGKGSVTRLAEDCGVSRKFLYRQARKASKALEGAFRTEKDEDKVLFHLPVTKNLIRRFVLAQVLLGHSSFRGIMEILGTVLNWPISLGTIHNILEEAIRKARVINQAQDLSGIRVGAHDEIYQANQPVLVGVDVKSLYCYLLAEEDHCDETTWGVHLLDLERQGLHPDNTVADGGTALRAGQAAAWGKDVPCHGDVFHAERDLGTLAFYLEHRATGCTSARQKLERQMERRKRQGRGNELSKKLAIARQEEAQAVSLAADIRLLSDWMKSDILSLAGPSLASRRELYDFVVAELAAREERCPHRIRPVRRALEQQRDNLLAFAGVLEARFQQVAARYQVPSYLVQQVCELQRHSSDTPAYRQRAGRLSQKLGAKFRPLQEAVRQVMAETPRASSVVENYNSRLRNYFFLRREIGNPYLDLLRFFLNHHRFLRSECPQRVGKSPVELLTGQSHPGWLELLGLEPVHQD
jgi:hypothetical protein